MVVHPLQRAGAVVEPGRERVRARASAGVAELDADDHAARAASWSRQRRCRRRPRDRHAAAVQVQHARATDRAAPTGRSTYSVMSLPSTPVMVSVCLSMPWVSGRRRAGRRTSRSKASPRWLLRRHAMSSIGECLSTGNGGAVMSSPNGANVATIRGSDRGSERSSSVGRQGGRAAGRRGWVRPCPRSYTSPRIHRCALAAVGKMVEGLGQDPAKEQTNDVDQRHRRAVLRTVREGQGSSGCHQYCETGATFAAQADTLAGL